MREGVVKEFFGIDPETADDVFVGYHVPSNRWNGWACPAFDRENAERVVAWINRNAEMFNDGDQYRAEWDGDTVVLWSPSNRNEGYEDERFSPDEDGLYDIGSYGWCWHEVEFPEGFDPTPENINRYLRIGSEETHLSVAVSNAVNQVLGGVVDRHLVIKAQNAASAAAIASLREITGRSEDKGV